MRIYGKRASQYSQEELRTILRRETGLEGRHLTQDQIKEIRKTINIREGRK